MWGVDCVVLSLYLFEPCPASGQVLEFLQVKPEDFLESFNHL